MEKETVANSLLPESHFISDWVPSFISRNQEGRIEEEPDFGASMDQFFECFDGLRNSQSALGNSGVWNWTCSVFSAITAATNLASGSLQIPIDEQHVETNLRITVSGISFYLSFIDVNQKPSCDFKVDRETHGLPIHYIDAKFQDSHFVMRVDRQGMDFEARVEHIEIADNYGDKNDVVDVHFSCKNIVEHRVSCIQQMQAAVEGALPSFLSLGKQGESAKVPCDSTTIQKGIFGDDVIRVKLLRTSGITQCKINLQSGSSDDNFMRPTSFTLRLPPFIFWVNFSLLGSLLDLLKEIGKSCRGVASEVLNHDLKPSSQGVVGERSYSRFKNLSTRESFKGNIFLPKARIILCFPFKSEGDFKSYFSWNQFIALDLFSSSTSSETEIKTTNGSSIASSKKRYGSAMSCSLYLNVGDLSIYLITSLSEEDVESSSPVLTKLKCLSRCVLFAKNQTGRLSGISMLWQESPVTGPWIAKKGKILASFDDARGRHKFMKKGYEFASVTTVKDIEDFTARSQKEMILSSTIFLHTHLSSVTVDVSRSQYERLRHLMDHMIDFLSCIASDPVSQLPSASQVSIIMECDSTAVSITTEAVESIKSSIQNELPGSWHGFRFEVKKFELLYVSNIGGIKNANFFSVAHGEGNLWGSISEVPKKELLLISCNDSTIGRGDGEGSNVLSSKYSGSDIVFLWDPQSNQSHTSITVRSGTIVAVGGRLDWLDPLSSFFIVPSSEVEQAGDDNLVKENESSGSFILNFVDIGLSYEPYFENQKQSDSGSGSVNAGERSCEQNVACLFAASSLKVSNVGSTDSIVKNYKIRVQDLGLLLCPVSQHRNIVGTYSVEHLHNIGYLKVAEEAHVEALFRMNSKNCPLWEVECSDSHIVLNTCHDTAFGLIRLVAQLQQLFSPELEESVMHLQTRWNNVQQAQECDESRFCSSASSSQVPPSSVNTMSKNDVNLMDEICEDAFHLDGHWEAQSDFGLFGGMNDSSVSDAESFPHNLSLTGPMSVAGLEKTPISDPQRSFPEFIEGYFLSNPPESSLNNGSSNGMFKCNSRETDREVQRGKSGWYRDSSLTVLENHAGLNEQKDPQLVHNMVPSSLTPDDFGKVNGHLFFKNINVIWKMYAGSDWQNFDGHDKDSVTSHGRDTTVCLELELSGMDFQYDIFPDGGISASRLLLSIQNFQLNDNSKDAPWKLVLGYYQSKCHPRESSSKSFKLDLEAVRPDPSIPLEEYRLRVAFLPMRLHLHQCHLDFLINFFGGKDSPVDKSPSVHNSGVIEIQTKKKANFGDHTIVEEALLPYFQKFDIWPVVLLVDYSPHRVDLAALRGGKYVELVNLVPWKGVELHLKHVQSVGVYGWSCVGETIIGEWLEDISENQIHKLLKGLPPIRSLVAVSSGVAKLVSTPLKNYRKDHRLIKGMQRGVIAFLRSISSEAIGVGVHLAASTHEILFQAECLLTNISSPLSWPVQSRTTTDVRSNQPKDARHGIQQAYDCVSDGLGKSASIFRVPIKKYKRGAGVGSAIVTAVQAAPAAAIAPASAVACAMHCTLLGVRNSLDPEHKKESVDKYTGRSHPESP